jgi:hypothetical protein
MVIAAFLLGFTSIARAEAPKVPEIQSLHCTAAGDLATYRADYDRAVDPQTLIFQSTAKADAKKILTYETTVKRWYHYQADHLRFAIRAQDGSGRWVEFAVAKDDSGREMGNDVWWYTEAVPSELVKFDCKTVSQP